MGTFALQMAAFIAKTKGDVDKTLQFALMSLDGKILSRSPVGDPSKWATPMTKSRKTGKMHWNKPIGYVGGRFKSNWQLSNGSPATGVLNLVDKDGTATKASHASFISTATAGGTIYLMNNLPYAVRLEQGWSRNQAPIGMVAVTVVEWGAMVDRAANDVKNGSFAAGFEAYPL